MNFTFKLAKTCFKHPRLALAAFGAEIKPSHVLKEVLLASRIKIKSPWFTDPQKGQLSKTKMLGTKGLVQLECARALLKKPDLLKELGSKPIEITRLAWKKRTDSYTIDIIAAYIGEIRIPIKVEVQYIYSFDAHQGKDSQ